MHGKINMDWHRTIPFTGEQLQSLVDRYLAGESTDGLSKAFGISRMAVTARLKTLGVELRKRGAKKQITDEVLELVADMRNKKKAWSEIQRDLGFASGYLRLVYRRYKLQKTLAAQA